MVQHQHFACTQIPTTPHLAETLPSNGVRLLRPQVLSLIAHQLISQNPTGHVAHFALDAQHLALPMWPSVSPFPQHHQSLIQSSENERLRLAEVRGRKKSPMISSPYPPASQRGS